MSSIIPKKYKSAKSLTKRSKSQNKKNVKNSAIDECKKLYQKYYSYPSNTLLKQFNDKYLKLFFEHSSLNDIIILAQVLSEFYFLQSIQISANDPEKPEEIPPKRKYKPDWISREEKKKKLKDKKIREEKYKTMFNKLVFSLAKHISKSRELISLSLNKLEFNEKYCQSLSKGISSNNSLQNLSITNSKLDLNSYEILLESLLNQNALTFVDLSNNNFGDKYGRMISRIISCHSQRRDQVVWFYSLRNELPPSNEYKKGLMFINLNGNNLSRDSAECISSVLYSDQYIRAIYLNNNKFDSQSCKKFIYMMRKNLSLLTIDLRSNPGYDEDIHHRLVIKMSKNIRYLFQQYKLGEYTEDEFEQLKEFIDISFFDVDIPQNVVEFYNNNLPQTTNDNDDKEENDESYEEYKKDVKTEIDANKINKIKNKIFNKNEMEEGGVDKEGDIIGYSINTNILEENKKLYAENLKLKKQIVELKAKNLRAGKHDNLNIEINDISKNNKIAKTESVLEDDYNKVEYLINELNELMNKIEEKTIKIDNEKNKNTNDKIEYKIEDKIKEENTKSNSLNKSKEKNVEKTDSDKKGEKNKNIIEKLNNNIKDNINKNKKIDEEEKKNSKENKDENNALLNNYQNQILNAEPTEEDKDKEKDKESSDDSHFVDDEGNIHNLDDLTDEEKMIILQQQLILQKLQEEAEARGEQFDPQEYFEFLERQAKEDEEEELNQKNGDDKLNKSF